MNTLRHVILEWAMVGYFIREWQLGGIFKSDEATYFWRVDSKGQIHMDVVLS